MTDQPNRLERTFEHLEELTIEQLEELLCASVDFSDKDKEYVDAIVDAIVKKEHENPTGRLPNVDEMWRSFRENFSTEEGEGLSLYPDNVAEKRPLVQPDREENLPKKNPHRRWVLSFRTMRGAAAIAVVTAMLTVGCMVGVQASGLNVFGYLAQWTSERFSFVLAPKNTEDSEYLMEFREVLEQHKISPELAPTWIPDGFHTDGPIYDEGNPFCDSVRLCFHHNDGREYTIRLDRYPSPEDIDDGIFEKDLADAETYISNGKSFYIFSNINTVTAAWADGTIVEMISGFLTMDEVKQIIDSIGG